MRPKTLLSLVLALVISGTVVGVGQDFQIRVRTDLVVVPFTVKNDRGRLVTGLTEANFTVREDGEPQTIEQFSFEPVPLSAVILIDSGLKEDSLTAIQESIPVWLDIVGLGDEFAVYRYDNQVFRVVDFTSDREELRAGLEKLKELKPTIQLRGGQSPLPSPVINGTPVVPTAPSPITGDKRVLHDAVYEVTRALRSQPQERRRVILLVSDGTNRDSSVSFEDNAFALMDAEVQIYAIGLNTSFFTEVGTSLDNYASLSGGDLYYRNSAGFQDAILQIGEQARNQYVLAYVSTNTAPPDRVLFRRIEVRCDQRYQVVHKDGYYQVP